MPLEKTDAIVIRLVEFSETSLIVTLFSRQFGRLSAIAKGARRPKGPFEGAIDLLAIGSMEVLRKPAIHSICLRKRNCSVVSAERTNRWGGFIPATTWPNSWHAGPMMMIRIPSFMIWPWIRFNESMARTIRCFHACTSKFARCVFLAICQSQLLVPVADQRPIAA